MTHDRLRCGAEGEAIAAAFLRARGYIIMERNFRCRAGEIDVIALAPDAAIVFCEIRTRRSRRQGSALESVTPAKQHRVAHVAEHYVTRHHLHAHAIRFDVVAVEMVGSEVRIEHVPDAFGGT